MGGPRQEPAPNCLFLQRYLTHTMTQVQNHHLTSVRSPATESYPDSMLTWALHDKLGSWEAIADALGFSGMFWWKVAHGKTRKPVSGELRRCLSSSDPKFLRLTQQGAVPWLRGKEDKWCCNQ